MSMTEPPDLTPGASIEAPKVDYAAGEGEKPAQPSLKRVIGFWGITFYGLGGIIGAGIFATIGAISGRSGAFAPFAFLIAAVPALFAALSYGELVKRFPKAGGEASFVQESFHRMWLTRLTAFGVAFSGIVSAATLLVAFAGYFQGVFSSPEWASMTVLLVISVALAGLGVGVSAGVVVVVTMIEGGLLALIALIGLGDLAHWPASLSEAPPPAHLGVALASSAVLAFFAFIGFEDVVNMAEEVKDAEHILPRALLTAFAISLALYLAVTAVAVTLVPIEQLSTSDGPLGEVVRAQGVLPGWLMTAMAMASIGNGVIIQVNMVSRLVYGLVEYRGAPEFLGRVSERTRTPLEGIQITGVLIFIFALALPLAQLAELTGVIVLLVFALVQAALMAILRREGAGARSFVVPVLGCGTALILLIGAFV